MRAVAYLRVSTEEQTRGDRASLDQQRTACRALAGQLGVTLERTFADPGVSGGTAEKRPGFMDLVAFCRAEASDRRRVGLVLVLNHSRWGRFDDPEEAVYWRVTLKKLGWTVRFAEGAASEDPIVSPILSAVHDGQASAYRAAIKANAKRGAASTAALGYWQNEAPLGYRRLALAPNGATRELALGQRKADDERVRLTPGPAAEVALIRQLFARYAEGTVSLGSLVAEAHQLHPTKRWSGPVLRAVLRNPAYIGSVVWGRRPHDALERRQTPQRDPSCWTVTQDAHPALVSPALFARVGALLERHRGARRLTAGGYPLSGLLRCATCGEAYTGRGGRRGPAGDLDRYRVYGHQSYGRLRPGVAGSACPYFGSTVPRRVLEPLVLDAVSAYLRDPRVTRALERALDRALAALSAGATGQRAELEHQRRAALGRRERLVALASEGTLTPDEIAGALAAVRAELAQLETAAQQQRFAAVREAVPAALRAELRARIRDAGVALRSVTGSALRELLRPWIQHATVDRARHVLELAFAPLPAVPELRVVGGSPGRDSR